MGSKTNESHDDACSALLTLAADSGAVASRRLAQILTGRLSMAELLRMGAEKQIAFAEAMTRAGSGIMRGDFPLAVCAATLAPYSRAVSANARRLGELDEHLPDEVEPDSDPALARLPGRAR